jgi:tripartite-type tricarboxylate transporter receptor subunit TctC
MRKHLIVLAALAAFLGASAPAFSQSDYPTRPITLIVPFPAGGVTDFAGREIARNLSKSLNQAVVVENRAGAGGNIGTLAVAKARPDGYTLGLLTVSAISIAPHITKNLGFHPEKDFTPISNVVTTPGAIVASMSTPFNTLQDMVKFAKEQPGKVTYASVGQGSIPHLTAEMFAQRAGVTMHHIPYKGAAPAMQDVLAGHVNLSFETSLVTAVPHHAAGRIKVLAITGPEQSPLMPNVPTVAQSGYPGFSAEGWFGLFGPAGLPPRIVEALNKATTDALRDPAVIERFEKAGTKPAPSSREAFVTYLREQDRNWAGIAKGLNLQLD